MVEATPSVLQMARMYKRELVLQMFGASAAAVSTQLLSAGGNILGIGYGAKVTAGAPVSGQPALLVYVQAKLPQTAVSASEKVPAVVNGLPTDVIAVGDLVALARPTPCGV